MNINRNNPHYKFAKYWESIGKPELEATSSNSFGWESAAEGFWFEDVTYRIKDDRHWQLRREWVDSDFTLPIEYFTNNINKRGKVDFSKPEEAAWFQHFNYRKAEIKQTHEQDLKALVMMELKSCPFCGGKAELKSEESYGYYDHSFVRCDNGFCLVRPATRKFDNTKNINHKNIDRKKEAQQEAIHAWNTRNRPMPIMYGNQ